MSLEAAIAENTKTMTALQTVMEQVAANQARLIAGQQAALDKIESPKASTPRAKKDEPKPAEPKADAPADAPKIVEQPTGAGEVTDDMVKSAATAWMDGKSDDERKVAAGKLNEVLAHFGLTGSKITGPQSKLDAEQRKQTRFFIQRWTAGHEVNFSADYDFDGDPAQGAEEENDPLG